MRRPSLGLFVQFPSRQAIYRVLDGRPPLAAAPAIGSIAGVIAVPNICKENSRGFSESPLEIAQTLLA
jgi:hypothetical protein